MTNVEMLAMPACGVVDLPRNAYCLELIFNPCNPCLQKPCEDCPISHLDTEGIGIDKALNNVENFIEQAKKAGLKRLEGHLIGGDSLTDWTRFVGFCEGVWSLQERERYPVRITATTCGICLDEEREDFLLKNSGRLRLIFRWNGAAGRRAWDNFSVLKYHSMTHEVDYFMIKSNGENFAVDIKEIAKMNKRIVLEFPNSAMYFQMLEKAVERGCEDKLFVREAPGGCDKRLCTVDFFGKHHLCRYFSPERMIYSVRGDARKKYDTQSACPVASYFLKLRT